MSSFHIVAKDFHSPLIRNEIWTNFAYLWPELADVPQPMIGIASRKNVISYLINLESWKACKLALQKRIEADSGVLKDLMDRSEVYGAEMNAFTESIWLSDLSSWSAEQLVEAYEHFSVLQSRQYGIGALLPLMDIGGVSYLESFLHDFLYKKLNSEDAVKAFLVFTTPTKNSFSLDQEEDLLHLAKKVIEDPTSRALLLSEHTQKHAWVYYVYQGPAFTEQQFGEFLNTFLQSGKDPKKELQNRAQDRANLLQEKDRLLSLLNPTQKERELLLLVSEFVWSKPRRKDYQSKSYYHMEAFYREWSRRTSTSLRHARAATFAQIQEGLLRGTCDQSLLERQFLSHVTYTGPNGALVLSGVEADEFLATFSHEEKQESHSQELLGNTAFPGLVRGTVKIVNVPEDMGKMNQGDILVAVSTTPSCVPAMKKAAAIVSDEGGLTCHAAIVSRELKVPCVVGTKFATSVLKDGDEVEVDATNGIVKIL